MDSAFKGRSRGNIRLPADLGAAIGAALDAQGPEVGCARTFARLVRTPSGRPIRSIITGRRTIVTGSYASRKARRSLPHESMIERAFFMHCEVDSGVVDYLCQPFRFDFVLGGKRRAYIPDCARLMDDGTVEVVELKADFKHLRDEDYAQKLQFVDQVCRHMGWRFRTVVARRLRQRSDYNDNVRAVQAYRFVEYLPAEVYAVAQAITAAGGECALRDLTDVWGDHRQGTAKLKAMVVGRVVSMDLLRPLHSDTLVSLVGNTSERRAAE